MPNAIATESSAEKAKGPQKIDPKIFADLKLVIATPTIDASVTDVYTDSRSALEKHLFFCNVQVAAHRVQDTYVDRARNILARAFLDTDAEWQLLLDDDMGFDAGDVLRMMYHAVTNPEIELIGAPYPQKRMDWERVKKVVLANPKVTPDQLACCCTSAWTFKGLPEGNHNMNRPIQLQQIGEQKPHVATGVMLVKRTVYEALKPHSLTYTDDQNQNQMWEFFDCGTRKQNWLGEDTHFCRAYHDIGGKIWLAPWVRTKHVGTFMYPGDVAMIIDSGIDLPA